MHRIPAKNLPVSYAIDTESDRLGSLRRRAFKWATRSSFAIIDQGVISGSNFVLGVILARKLVASEYGAYALAFSVFLLLSAVYHALMLEPMSVFGGSSYRPVLRRYLGLLLWLQVGIGPVSFLILAGIAVVLSSQYPGSPVTAALLGVSFAAPAVLLLWFARRALYLDYLSKFAALGAVLYTSVLFGLLKILYGSWRLSPLLAFVCMGAAALFASILLLARVRPQFRTTQLTDELKQIIREHWRYGRWAIASALFIWIPWNMYYAIVTRFSGLASAGELRALLNLAMPMTQTYAALSLLMLPRTAGVAHRDGWPGVKRQAATIASAFTAVAIGYWVIVSLWRTELLGFLYAGHYGNMSELVPWLAVASVLSGTIFGPLCAFRAMHSPSTVCWIYSISTGVSVVIGVPATRAYGTAGAIAGIVLSSALALVIGVVWLLRSDRQIQFSAPVTLADAAS
jgi:O-antigen/teichoic acid export membrane protein